MQMTQRAVAKMLAIQTFFALFLGSAQAAEVTLKLHHFLPENSLEHKQFIVPWKEAVERESGGRIEVLLYPAMSLGGKAPDLIDQAKSGVADIVWTLPSYTPGRFPAVSVFELPFMVTNAEDTSQALQEFYETTPVAQDEFKSVHPLFFWTHDRGVLHTKNYRVQSLDDLKGLRIRAPGRQVADALKAYGAKPVMMPVPQMPKAMKNKEIDGSVIPWEVSPVFHMHELADNSTEFSGERGIYTAVFVFAMNKDKYDSMPEDLKEVIDHNSGIGWSKFMGSRAAAAEEPGRKLARDHGVNIVTMPASEVKKFRDASYSIHAVWAREMSEKGINGRRLLFSAYNLLNKYSRTLKPGRSFN